MMWLLFFLGLAHVSHHSFKHVLALSKNRTKGIQSKEQRRAFVAESFPCSANHVVEQRTTESGLASHHTVSLGRFYTCELTMKFNRNEMEKNFIPTAKCPLNHLFICAFLSSIYSQMWRLGNRLHCHVKLKMQIICIF